MRRQNRELDSKVKELAQVADAATTKANRTRTPAAEQAANQAGDELAAARRVADAARYNRH